MIINYVLMAVTGLLLLVGIIEIVKKSPRIHIFRTIAAGIVFVLVIIATLQGLTYDQLLAIIEGR